MQQLQESASQLETLLGSLIKMVGRTNERIDSLDKRVRQMEWVIRETHMITHEEGGPRLYAYMERKN
ncbi:hypothetical protein [Neobacillus sp. D3-1R]|uniref:hypothetical protein n=1 Tax=Neobacillus sp. D3-1R TaxID=3445778 RepID=UPI003FA03FA9